MREIVEVEDVSFILIVSQNLSHSAIVLLTIAKIKIKCATLLPLFPSKQHKKDCAI